MLYYHFISILLHVAVAGRHCFAVSIVVSITLSSSCLSLIASPWTIQCMA